MFGRKALDVPAVVFDNGSGLCKAGVAGEKRPRAVISTVVGYPKLRPTMIGAGHRSIYIGNEALAKRAVLTLTYPMEHGIVSSWKDMETVWRHMYEFELKLKSWKRPVILTEAPQNPLKNREMMTEIMFENFKVPAVYVSLQAMMALYAAGQTTGIVLDSGDGVTHSIPIYEGHCLLQNISRMDFAGRDITKYFAVLLAECGYSFVSCTEREIVRDIKEKMCYIVLDPRKEVKKKPQDSFCMYELPDGNTIKIGDQVFRAPEALFCPVDAGISAPGIHKMILQSICKCDPTVQKYMFGNVVLAGGSTLFPGISKRIYRELEHQTLPGTHISISAPPDRILSGWIGASVLSSLSSFQELWVTAMEYKEYGPAAIHRKCF
ncbi:hypothetical protein FKM82_014814 [Ascaphus truei]|uniref:uncharacterized protein LOC142500926 n=1 Tax=Ascaphus truei TaxID=8439 RepID=UPI003F591AB5